MSARLAPGVDFREGNALALPWPDAAFDAVVCQFGLMFFGDREHASTMNCGGGPNSRVARRLGDALPAAGHGTIRKTTDAGAGGPISGLPKSNDPPRLTTA